MQILRDFFLFCIPNMDVNSSVHEKKDLNLGGEASSPDESSLTLVRSGGSSHTTTKQDVVPHSIDQLPIGILHKVVDHLDLVALVCLQSSNRHFYNSISIDPSLLSVCIRWRIHVHFWNDRQNERLEKACMLCKIKRKHQRFQDGDERLVIEGPAKSCSKGHIKSSIIRENITPDRSATEKLEWTLTDPTTALFYKIPEPSKSLVESYVDYTFDHIYHFTHGHPRRLDPRSLYRWYKLADGLCYDHLMEQFGTNKTIEALLPLIQLPPKPTWLRFTVLRCLHCGKCVEEGDSRLHGCLNCCCDVCHRRISHQHYRTGPRQTQNPQLRRILGDELGSLWIYEVGSKCIAINMHGRTQKLTKPR